MKENTILLKCLLVSLVFTTFSAISFAIDGRESYAKYRNIIDQKSVDESERRQTAKQYLQSLSQQELKDFVREVAKQPGFENEREGHLVAMVVFAQYYVESAGKNESTIEIIKQLSDLSLPAAWKWALMDVLSFENQDFSVTEFVAINKALLEIGLDPKERSFLRNTSFKKAGSMLWTQIELLSEKVPRLKDALIKQDKLALQKLIGAAPMGESEKKAIKLLESIDSYKEALRKACEQSADGQLKVQIAKLLSEWESSSVVVPKPTPK